MRVFVAGATGVLGKRLVGELTGRGHEVVGLTRDENGDRLVEGRGGVPRRGDVLDRPSVLEAVDEADVVVHAATRLPTDAETTADDWERNDRVRLEGGRNLLAAATAVDAERVVFPSVVWAYRRPDGSEIDVDAPPNPDRTTRSAVETERLIREAADESGFEATVLRYGWFYGPDSVQTREIATGLLERDLPIVGDGLLGRGETLVSTIHADDAARAMAAAIDAGASGTWHVVDDQPVTTDAFFGTFAEILEADPPRRVPAWLAKRVVAEDLVRFLTSDFPASNDRFVEAVGWEPTYPTVTDGLEAVVERWRTEGVLVEPPDGDEWAKAPG